jgi:hypothetical protein
VRPLSHTKLAAIFLGGVTASALWAQPHAKKSSEPISLEEIRERGISGELGPRLGAIVEVAGEFVANTQRTKATSAEKFMLSITSVKGHRLNAPVQYPLSKSPFIKPEFKLRVPPKIGDKFRFIGYETGSFTGSPEGEFDYVEPYATTDYFFDTSFEVIGAK